MTGATSRGGTTTSRPGRLLRQSGRMLALTDQALSGLSNFLTVALVARSVDPQGFGRFAVAYALFLAFVGLARQLWGTRIALTTSPDHALEQARELTGVALAVAPLAAVALVASSVALSGSSTLPVAVLLAVALPLVVVQDLVRYASIAAGRPAVAAVSDLVWLLVVLGAYAFRPPLLIALAVWLGGAILALLTALLGLRVTPTVGGAWKALRRRHSTGEATAVGYVAASAATYITLGLATVTVGAAAAGAVRGASTVMAPVNTLIAFAGLAMLPVIVRTAPHLQLTRVGQVSGALVLASSLWGAVLLLLPPTLGQLLLGESWAGARAVLPWVVAEYVAATAASGAVLGLQAHHHARHLALVLVSGSTFVVAGAVVASVLGDSAGAFAAGLAAGAFLYAVLAWATYYRRRSRRTAIPDGRTPVC